ncbi:MAG: hypothetical protein CO118_00845 [Flavobacteriales bacterium CG_4_9_14_3_um_filter_32_8]|nr:MAG: hypothetical protein CO118_00845 [Flavobacteriales bacterium CG_4_9_14_3_um_filter_32_8]
MLESLKFKVQRLKLKDFLLFSLIIFTSCFTSCKSDSTNNDAKNQNLDSLNNSSISTGEPKIIEPMVDEKIEVLTNNGITLTELKSDNNKNASIQLNTKQFTEGINQLQFSVDNVDNYTISYLANNYSLTQFSVTNIKVELLYGNNVFLAFLTDKNNFSIKTNKGSVLKNAVLGGDIESLFDMNQPHLFYYLPQSETINPILDFYLVNTSISENGNRVKVTINETEFSITKWAAYQISGLKKPSNTIRIQLLDKNGKLIEGPFNDSGERSFNLINKSSKLDV